MKPFLHYTFLLFILSSICGCVDDKGNYTYKDETEVMPVRIEGLETEMTVQTGETLNLSPELKNMDNPDLYTHEWYVMEYSVQGKAPQRRDIGNTKDLNYEVTLRPGVWRLGYKIINPKNNLFTRAEIKLTVIATPVDNKGWYILKDNGEETDFDYINPEGTAYKDVLREKGLQLPGTAISMEYQPLRYSHNIVDESGNVELLAGQSVFHVVSTQELYTINTKTLELFKDFNAHFYSDPVSCEPQSYMHVTSGNCFLQNAGRLYTINAISPNIGKLYPISGNYHLHKGGGIPSNYKNCIVFDELTRSFLIGDGYNDFLTNVPDLEQEGRIYSFQNMPYSLICSGYNGTGQGYFVMRHNESDEGALLRVIFMKDIASFSVLPPESKLLQAELITNPLKADFLYFTYGKNRIYSYENASGLPIEDREKEVLSYPEGETITSIRQVFAAGTGDSPKVNQLAVLTTQDGKWKLYLYDLMGESTPEINPEPVKVHEGEGNGRYLLYRSA